MVEKSRAIKCPSVPYQVITAKRVTCGCRSRNISVSFLYLQQLAGCKKIQQSLADEDVLRHFLPEPAEASMITELMDCFTGILTVWDNARIAQFLCLGLWPLDTGDCDQVCKMVLASPRDYVMKPQREGGGNNVYGEELVRNTYLSVFPISVYSYVVSGLNGDGETMIMLLMMM